VGCGTGAVLSDLPASRTAAQVLIGLDINIEYLHQAMQNVTQAGWIAGDGIALPLASASLDAAFCHYVLLWLLDPLAMLKEMHRVVKAGGVVLALAEPDYGGRIDYPQSLSPLGNWQQVALCHQGADPLIGRRLASLFLQAGLTEIEVGVMGGQWRVEPTLRQMDWEWLVLQDDLEGLVSPEALLEFHLLDQAAREKGERILFVPTFYALGKVSG
jgi:SAM-dependent methyltransferase